MLKNLREVRRQQAPRVIAHRPAQTMDEERRRRNASWRRDVGIVIWIER